MSPLAGGNQCWDAIYDWLKISDTRWEAKHKDLPLTCAGLIKPEVCSASLGLALAHLMLKPPVGRHKTRYQC